MPVIPAALWLRRQALDGRLRLLIVLLSSCVPLTVILALTGGPTTRWPLLFELALGVPTLLSLGWAVLVGPTIAVRRTILRLMATFGEMTQSPYTGPRLLRCGEAGDGSAAVSLTPW